MSVKLTGYVEGSSIVVAGQTITVCVTVSTPDKRISSHNSNGELVSWCSAQIHCVATTNDAIVIPPKPFKPTHSDSDNGNPGTSFAPWQGEAGHLVHLTKPTILFCDLLLQPGQSRTFKYKETIPANAAPSYRGHRVKYSWKVTVGAQRHGAKIALIRLPMRVILLPAPTTEVLESAYSESEEELSPTNPFLHINHTSPHKTPVSPPASLLQVWPARSVRAYNIVHSKGHVVKFSIFRNSYKLGDDILATLDFTNGQIPCVQYSVCLQSVEGINEEHRRRSKQSPSIVSFSKTHELCLSMTHTSLMLPVPLHITPAFHTDMIDLQYRLHFEFVLSMNEKKSKYTKKLPRSASNSSQGENSSDSESQDQGPYDCGTLEALSDGTELWRAPSQLNIETLVWDLPVHLCPAPPHQLSVALNLPQSCASNSV